MMITIGKPIANTQIYIVDRFMQPVPIGVTGELCIAGDGVGAGYLNRPELTAEKFVDNPFGKGKLYKTGDLAYWLEDGNIVFVGRNDFQVKIRGLRIELGEIENALQAVKGINQAVVVVRKNQDGRQLICAFYTGAEQPTQALRSQIGERLPKYMLPHIFTRLEKMPLTPSGKIARKDLPEIDLEHITSSAEYAEPETEMQRRLCALMAKTLGVERIGINDDFFDLGGDSLKAIMLISEAKAAGIDLSLQSLFEHPTVAALCRNTKIAVAYYADTDFTAIHKLLSDSYAAPLSDQKAELGRVLLSGATGFLGAHILAELLETTDSPVYCLVRGDAEVRLRETLRYYFGERYAALVGTRILPLAGDIMQVGLGLPSLPAFGTVIHAAASVKHYGNYSEFEKINVFGTENMMRVAEQGDAYFLQISTLSVSGNASVNRGDKQQTDAERQFSERDLYIGQNLEHVYARSKFEAERRVLSALAAGRLRGAVIRVGNLTNRASDLKFQPNYETNAFLNRLRAIIDFGCISESLLPLCVEFSPVDDTARAIVTLARFRREKKVMFHVYSHNDLHFDVMLDYLKRLQMPMTVLDRKAFAERFRTLEQDASRKYIYEAFVNEIDENGEIHISSDVHINGDMTLDALESKGFAWSANGFDYFSRYIKYFQSIGYLKKVRDL